MPPRIRLLWSGLCVTLVLLAALPLYTELTRRRDIWWTPPTMLVPITESQDRVEIYARGKPMAALLEAGHLRITDETGEIVLGTSDVGLRFNNWDRVRAERLPLLLGSAAACGAMAILFLLVVTGRLAYRRERDSVAP
jgi:hypothetical protein